MSETLWGVDWPRRFPVEITRDGITVDWIDYEQAAPFVRDHYAAIFEDSEDSPFTGGKITDARSRYYATVGDFFGFFDEDRLIGLFVGTPVDWATYYIRSGALLPEYEGRNLIQRFLPLLFSHLKEVGVERVESETAPSNMSTVYLLTRQRFNVSGTVLSERWGVLTRFTKFLDEDSEDIFLRQFCMGRQYQKTRKAPSS